MTGIPFSENVTRLWELLSTTLQRANASAIKKRTMKRCPTLMKWQDLALCRHHGRAGCCCASSLIFLGIIFFSKDSSLGGGCRCIVVHHRLLVSGESMLPYVLLFLHALL